MVVIDFIGGSHGNFLEVCTNRLAGIEHLQVPFSDNGASHNKVYSTVPKFVCGHWSVLGNPLPSNRVISVRIHEDDLLPLTQISLLRAGDDDLDQDNLHIDTWNKLDRFHRLARAQIQQSFFHDAFRDGYQAIRDPSWPDVDVPADYDTLPQPIRDECENLHRFEIKRFDKDHPDCDRSILREFFEHGFLDPENQGFIQESKKMVYVNDCEVFDFEYRWFYNEIEFMTAMHDVAEWAGLAVTPASWQNIQVLHQQFMQRQPFWHSRIRCLQLVEDMKLDGALCPPLTLLEEEFLNSQLIRQGYERRYRH
jgi:hypothetical protein